MDFIPELLSLLKLQTAPHWATLETSHHPHTPPSPHHSRDGNPQDMSDFSGIIIAIRNNSARICNTDVLNTRRQTNQGKLSAMCFCWNETVLRELCLPIAPLPPEPWLECSVKKSLYHLWCNCSELGKMEIYGAHFGSYIKENEGYKGIFSQSRSTVNGSSSLENESAHNWPLRTYCIVGSKLLP